MDLNELPLALAVQQGLNRINYGRTAFRPNVAMLLADLQVSSELSGVVVVPSRERTVLARRNYELAKFAAPAVPASPTLAIDAWNCAKEHYGLTAVATALGIGGVPISKIALGHPIRHGSSKYTNLISHFGIKFFPMAKLPAGSQAARIAKTAFGTIRVFGVIGRAVPFVAIGLAVFDAVSIGLCVYEQRHGK